MSLCQFFRNRASMGLLLLGLAACGPQSIGGLPGVSRDLGPENPSLRVAKTSRSGPAIFISADGERAFEEEFLRAYDFSEGLAPVQTAINEEGDKKWGYINANGEFAIDPKFNVAAPFQNNVALVFVDGKSALIDRKGKTILESPSEDMVISGTLSEEGLVPFGQRTGSRKLKYGFLDARGEVAIDPIYTNAQSFEGGVAIVEKPEKLGDVRSLKGLIDSEGNAILPTEHDAIIPFAGNKHFLVRTTVEEVSPRGFPQRTLVWRVFDASGEVVLEDERLGTVASCASSGLGVIHQELIPVRMDKSTDPEGNTVYRKCGFLDLSGELAIAPQFESATTFSEEGIAGVRVAAGDGFSSNGGFIDSSGNFVVEPQERISEIEGNFHLGLAEVRVVGQGNVLIDKNGEIVHPVY